MEYLLELAGIPLRLQTESAIDHRVFERFKTGRPPDATAKSTPEFVELWKNEYDPGKPEWVAEYNEIASGVTKALLPFGRCVFHGVAFIWHAKAWIFTARSGVGKTTQYALWKILYDDEISILNGDKPILECRADGTVYVHPSPWQGKENFGSMDSAQLGGIICLSRGNENSICRMKPVEALIPIYRQILYYADNAESAEQAIRVAEQVATSVPIWRLRNMGDKASAILTHDTLVRFEENEE